MRSGPCSKWQWMNQSSSSLEPILLTVALRPFNRLTETKAVMTQAAARNNFRLMIGVIVVYRLRPPDRWQTQYIASFRLKLSTMVSGE